MMRLQWIQAALFLSGSLVSIGGYAQPSEQCLTGLQQEITEITAGQERIYRTATTGRSGIKAGAESRLLPGERRDEAVLLVHGFLATPQEVSELGEILNHHGYTVLMPLVTGFGGDDSVANAFDHEYWRRSYEKSFVALSRCFPRIMLAGFSLGGGLTMDFVINRHNDLKRDHVIESEISAVFLFAPYLRPASHMASVLNPIASKVGNIVGLDLLFHLTRNPDLRIPRSHPESYNKGMPLKAVTQILSLSKEFKQVSAGKRVRIPTYLYYSEADRTVDVQEVERFLSGSFAPLKVTRYPKFLKIRHQILMKESGNDVEALAADILSVLSPSW